MLPKTDKFIMIPKTANLLVTYCLYRFCIDSMRKQRNGYVFMKVKFDIEYFLPNKTKMCINPRFFISISSFSIYFMCFKTGYSSSIVTHNLWLARSANKTHCNLFRLGTCRYNAVFRTKFPKRTYIQYYVNLIKTPFEINAKNHFFWFPEKTSPKPFIGQQYLGQMRVTPNTKYRGEKKNFVHFSQAYIDAWK